MENAYTEYKNNSIADTYGYKGLSPFIFYMNLGGGEEHMGSPVHR